ncbi:HAD family hydrolase [Synechococcus sp. 7002]|uniref:HAD family hydrolase n=1 Tax=Synechococcus sp. 7002 TaxID=1938862 RepID=UPI0030DAD81F
MRLAQQQGAAIAFDKDAAEAVDSLPVPHERHKFNRWWRNSQRSGGCNSRLCKIPWWYSPETLDQAFERVSRLGGTPLALCQDDEIYGVIYLKDIIKSGIHERFDQLRRMGVRTVMLTGDNRITAEVIAREAGVDDFVAEATLRIKFRSFRRTAQANGSHDRDGTNDAQL